MTHHAQQDSDIAMLNDVQERLARLQVAHGIEYMNTASYIQHMPRQPVHAAANPLLGSIHLVLRLKSQPPPQPQDKIRVQNIDETDSATDPDDQSQASTDDDTLSDFGSDSDNDAVWDCALDDAESVQEEPSDEKEEPVDYLAIMEADIAINAAALEGRENIGWEARWNIAEEVMLGEIAIYEMDRYDPDEEIYPWEFEIWFGDSMFEITMKEKNGERIEGIALGLVPTPTLGSVVRAPRHTAKPARETVFCCGNDDDTLSDFGSDSDNDAVWDRAMDDCESVPERQPSTDKEKQVDYSAMMENDINATSSSESSVSRENTGWEVEWNGAEEVMLGEIVTKEMDLYDADVKVHPWEYKPE
ncbi:hypothetical protein BJ741DRAFT_585146 [Chytriomyces cf. hyalinus JEL632]|nr:hypothetical protein BJ741DRAFT_585146 [Chytriomyces cf. hyalinus JEL632]